MKDIGKVAALVDTNSPLAIGLMGKYNGKSFRLTGRAQLSHALGGVWDEWYAAFDDNRWGWLAEAQGRLFLTFEEHADALPDFDSLVLGERVPNLKAPYVVFEKGEARYASAEGEIPFALVPNTTSIYADLSGDLDRFATLDYSEETPVFYSGNEVTLAQLSLEAGAAHAKLEKRVAITNLACPSCGGSLNLRVPDDTQRIGCPYCGSLLDCTQGKLSIFQALDKKKVLQPLLPFGSVAEFEGANQTIIGFMRRSCIVERTTYYWQEYLLYSSTLGFRWLVHSDNHWTYARPVQTAAVSIIGRYAYSMGKSFKRFQDAPAKVESVLGEFYWKVTIGEAVYASDFVCPPQMLSCERTKYHAAADGVALADGSGEFAWSLGEYVPVDEIESKFKVNGLRRPGTVGTCQPNPHQGWIIAGLKGVAAVIGLTMVLAFFSPARKIFEKDITLTGHPNTVLVSTTTPTESASDTTETSPEKENATESASVWLSEPFELKARQKISIEIKTDLNNTWLSLDGALIDETSGEVLPFEHEIEYYSGSDEDGAWSEGDRNNSKLIPAQPAGKYMLRLEGNWERMTQPVSFHIALEQTCIDPVFFFMALVCVCILPVIGFILNLKFESSRWNESMYGGGSDGGSDSDSSDD